MDQYIDEIFQAFTTDLTKFMESDLMVMIMGMIALLMIYVGSGILFRLIRHSGDEFLSGGPGDDSEEFSYEPGRDKEC